MEEIGSGALSATQGCPIRARSFTPAFEIGYRPAKQSFGQGYATEAAQEAVRYGFEQVGLAEVVSMTAVRNVRSQAVMNELGMTRHPADDFDHPRAPNGHRCAATRPVPAHGRALAQCGSVKHPGYRHLWRPPDGAQPRALRRHSNAGDARNAAIGRSRRSGSATCCAAAGVGAMEVSGWGAWTAMIC
ncbi:MAG: GNAT family N-acetyltransferase [Dermatophilaceae bacterium]